MSEKALEGRGIPTKKSVHQRNAKIRAKRRNGSQIFIEKVVDSYGRDLVFDNLPYYLMGHMITKFRCYEFDYKYDKQCSIFVQEIPFHLKEQNQCTGCLIMKLEEKLKVTGLLIYN